MAVRSAAKFGIALWGNLFTHVLKRLGPGVLRLGRQVTKSGTMSGPNFSYLYAPMPLTVFECHSQFLTNFFETQEMLISPSCTTFRSFFTSLT